MFLNGLIGKKRMMPDMLKKRWHSAICKATGSLSLDAANAARIPVPVVPMLAPRVNGNILSSLIIPIPTRGVNADVNTELL